MRQISKKQRHTSPDDKFVSALLKNEGKEKVRSIAPHREKLTSEALRYGSHSFYLANTPYLPLPCKCSPNGATTG